MQCRLKQTVAQFWLRTQGEVTDQIISKLVNRVVGVCKFSPKAEAAANDSN